MRVLFLSLAIIGLGHCISHIEDALVQSAHGQVTTDENTELSFNGLFQGRFSYVDTGDGAASGFGIRRMYLRADASLAHNLGIFAQINARGGSVLTVDAGARFAPSPEWLFRGGRFVMPQPGAAAQPPGAQIDAADRASIGEWWAHQYIGGDRRDFGIDARYGTEMLTISVAVHSGNGQVGNFRPRVWEQVPATPSQALAIGSSVLYHSPLIDNLEVGLYGNYNPNPPLAEHRNVEASYTLASHVYWGTVPGSQPLRFKADFWRADSRLPDANLLEYGFAGLGAVHPTPTTEFFARGELLSSNLYSPADQTLFLTTGAHYSLSARRGDSFYRQRLTFAISALEEGDGLIRPSAVLQLQLTF